MKNTPKQGDEMTKQVEHEYSDKMIEAFIDKPEKTLWYRHAFSKFNVNGVDAMKWHWSWWAFFGSFFFLLYRKQYVPALVLFIASVTIGMVFPLSIVISILAGGYSTYFIYKGYKKQLLEVEANVEDVQKRVDTMREIAGFHQWVIWLYAVISIFFFGTFTFVLFGSFAR